MSDIVDQIRNSLDITELVREYVPELTKSGRNFKARCPFHSEKTPSFFVNPDHGLFKCFGCGEGGDVIRFLAKIESLTFGESIKILAERAGIKLEKYNRETPQKQEFEKRERLFALLELAASFYEKALADLWNQAGPAAYLQERKVSRETAQKFRLGFVPEGGSSFLETAMHKGFSIDELTAGGMVSLSEKTGRYRDNFAGRIIFPVFDNYGRITGFGGRIMPRSNGAGLSGIPESEAPKYLNSSESPVFSKGKSLYGVYHGKNMLRETGQAIVVEGYMDVLASHQSGVRNTVAPLGTALTQEQARYLKRFANEVVLMLDPDAAGLAATKKAIEVLLEHDIYPRVCIMPDGLDPDEFIAKEGNESFKRHIDGAKDWLDFYLSYNTQETLNADFPQRVKTADEFLTLISRVPNEIYKREWIKKTAGKLKLDENFLLAQLNKPKKRYAPVQISSPVKDIRTVEEEVLQLLKDANLWSELNLTLNDFIDGRCARLFTRMQRFVQDNGTVTSGVITSDLNEEDTSWASGILLEEKIFDNPKECLTQLIEKLKAHKLELGRQKLGQEVAAMMAGESAWDDEKINSYRALTRILKSTPKEAANETSAHKT